MKQVVIASRESPLAMWQAEHIRARLQALYPGLEVSILGITTQGDRILDKTLNKIGGKGLFVKELELAMQEGQADLAVHSIKDVPMDLPEGFALAAICEREDRAMPSCRRATPASRSCRPAPWSARPACAAKARSAPAIRTSW